MQSLYDFDITPCLDGDFRSWSQLVGRFTGLVHGVALRVMRARRKDLDLAVVPHVTRCVFLRLARKNALLLRGFDPARCSLAAFLVVVARATALDWLRYGYLNAEPLDDFDTPARTDASGMFSDPQFPEGVLTDRQQLVMQLLFAKDYEVATVAEVLGITPQTVRSIKHEAVKRLRFYSRGMPAFN